MFGAWENLPLRRAIAPPMRYRRPSSMITRSASAPIKGKGYVDRYQRLIMVDRAMVPSDGDNSRAGCSPAVIVTPHECCNLCES
jgi:hypothetical protein